MKKPFVFTFFLFSFHFSLVFALPFQDPIPGSYNCFAAGDDPFNVAAQNTGAILEIYPNNIYILKTASASEQGIFDVEEFLADADLFERGSSLGFVPDSSDVFYPGQFFVDTQGERYVLIQLSDYSYLRCESANADISVVLENTYESATDVPEIPVTPEDELLPTTTKASPPPANAGGLSGFYVYTDNDGTYVPTFGTIPSGYLEFHDQHLYFLPDGYVYSGIYEWSYEALDCTRLRKDNFPLCDTYVISGNSIKFSSYASSFVKDGNDLLIDGKRFVYQTPADDLKFDGKFLFASFDGYSLVEVYHTFYLDGTLRTEASSANNATASVAGTTTYSSSYSETPTTVGRYNVRGNTIELIYEDGRTVKRVFNYETDAAGQVAYIYINGVIYAK
jgi:hypothetical protein